MHNIIVLEYALRRSPSAQRALRSILDAQKAFNQRVRWASDPLNLTPIQSEPWRGSLAFPLIRIGEGRSHSFLRHGADVPEHRIPGSIATGRTRLHSVWDAHLLVAFLQELSEQHSVCIELRDQSGFIRAGAILLNDGKVELQRDWLNQERARVLEATGNPEVAAPLLFAECEATQGRFLEEGDPSDYPADIVEEMSWEQLESTPMSEVARQVVNKILEPVAVAHA